MKRPLIKRPRRDVDSDTSANADADADASIDNPTVSGTSSILTSVNSTSVNSPSVNAVDVTPVVSSDKGKAVPVRPITVVQGEQLTGQLATTVVQGGSVLGADPTGTTDEPLANGLVFESLVPKTGFQQTGAIFLPTASAADAVEAARIPLPSGKKKRAVRRSNFGAFFLGNRNTTTSTAPELPLGNAVVAESRSGAVSDMPDVDVANADARDSDGQIFAVLSTRHDPGGLTSEDYPPSPTNQNITNEKIARDLAQSFPDTQISIRPTLDSAILSTAGSPDPENSMGSAPVSSAADSGQRGFDPADTPLAREITDLARRRAALAATTLPLPGATRVFTVANQKGGVGKTTSAVNLAASLARSGARVLVIDLDPQGNASTALGVAHRAETPSVYDVIIGGDAMQSVVQVSPLYPTLFCVPATIHLAGAEIELVSLVAREQRLRTALETFLTESAEPFHYVFIDCPPSLGLLTINAFVSAGEVLIPIQCEYYALEGLSQLLGNIALIEKHLNPSLKVSTILLTMFDSRTNLANQVAQEVRDHFPKEVLGTLIPRSVRISEAPSYGQTVISYDPHSAGSLSYQEAAAEIAQRGAPI